MMFAARFLGPLRPVLAPLVDAPSKRRLEKALNVTDLRRCAELRTHPTTFSYLDSGAVVERTLSAAWASPVAVASGPPWSRVAPRMKTSSAAGATRLRRGHRRVVVFGGTGFVGAKILESLVRRGVPQVVSISRSGARPSHLALESWANRVSWRHGDAADLERCKVILQDADAVVVSMGSPPLPFVDYDFQVAANGATNETVLEAAAAVATLRKAVLVNATMPQWAPKGYRDGKLQAYAAAQRLANRSELEITVLKPTAIYGTRYERGWPVPLAPALAPLSWLLQTARPVCDWASSAVPSLFDGVLAPPVPVEAVADAAVAAVLPQNYAVDDLGNVVVDDDDDDEDTGAAFRVLGPHDILQFRR